MFNFLKSKSDSAYDSVEYRLGYINGIQACKNDIRNQIIELRDNYFINSLEDVIKYLESKGM